MEEKKDQEEFKHVCKLCNKRYPSGKNSGYGLRENPKKTWRLVNSKLVNNTGKQQPPHDFQQQQQQERVCKQCGKGFHSLKALCGHMSSHSEKERHFKEEDDNSWSSDSKDQLILAMESHSDNNNSNNNSNNNNNINNNHLKRQTRSSLLRYKSLTTVDSQSPPPPGGGGFSSYGCGGGGGGGSSSNHSEIDQHEQEEVAICLMMLSRDSSGHNKSCFNFTAESSDNNSVILEGGSSSNHVGIGRKRKDFCLNNNTNKKKIKQVVVVAQQQIDNVVNHQEIDNSDSGYFENGAKELESDDSVDGFVRNYGFKKPKSEFGSKIIAESFYDYDNDSRKRRNKQQVSNLRDDSPESDENSSKKMKMMKQDYYRFSNNNNNNKKGSKYECCVCNKTFKTHQALGGHIISHRKNGENSLDTSIISGKQQQQQQQIENNCNPKKLAASTTKNMGNTKSKKVKGHKCPYCPKVFKSGQALGGHKRSHMIGSNAGVLKLQAAKSRIERVPLPEHEPKQPPLIDLNLPAPMEEEGSGNSQFVAW
ncbi:hypothetical protein BVRB_6g136840 [Beta vulgaris subsp. vulgaris]|nr:hypothetical protein BVRB_6g136840 [Beta vulgaris subsp. vulgaris]